jgi:hypothetical protein
MPWNARSTCEQSCSSHRISPDFTSASPQSTTPGPADTADTKLDVCGPKLFPTCANPTPITDRTLPGYLRVYASTLQQSGEVSSKSQRVTREIAINIQAGSLNAPGKIERLGRRIQSSISLLPLMSFDEEVVNDEEFSVEDLGKVLMEEPEDSWPQFVCDGSCRKRMKALKGGNALGPTVVCLTSRFLAIMEPDEVDVCHRFSSGLLLTD